MALNLSYSLADQDFHHTKSLGVWNVSTQLLKHLAAHSKVGRITVFSNRHQTELSVPPNVELVPHEGASTGRMGRIFWDQWGVYSAAQQAGHPWLFLPKGFAPIFRRCPVRLAAYVHDTMHDYYQRNYPDDPERNPLARETGYFSRSLRATLREADMLFTNTEFTRNEIIRISKEWGVRTPPIVCAGVGFNLAQPTPVGERNRIVVLIGPWPHKCTPLAIERLSQWASTRGFAGGVDWVGALPPHAHLPERPGWLHHQRLSPEAYDRVLSGARILVYFSTYEGFGMPPVEGTLAGAAAVYSAIPAMREVMNGCGFCFSNESFEQFAAAMDAAMQLEPAQLEAWQKALRARHNWTVVAKRITETLSALEAEPQRGSTKTSKAVAVRKKVLVFAHTPPPHHGQSYMIQQMLHGFGGDQRDPKTAKATDHGIACYHVNSRLSRHMEDIGEARIGKLGVLFWYCLEAIWCRFRYGLRTFYYVPAPGKRPAVIRDWMVMALCRPFFPRVVFHWHAAGLGQWLTQDARGFERTVTQKLLGHPSLSIIISDFNRADAELLRSKQTLRVDYGIPDPCLDFESSLLGERHRRAMGFQQALDKPVSGTPNTPVFNVLFLANCFRTKGVFVALEAFTKFQQKVHSEAPGLRTHLRVGGAFGDAADEDEFHSQIQRANASGTVEYLGFVSGAQKDAVLRQADLLCFPTYYPGENQPIVLIESLAYGLPAVTTHWRSIPDIYPPAWPGVVPIQDADATAAAMWKFLSFLDHERLRARYIEHFTVEVHQRKLAAAIGGVT
jgi:glycosyltransferase involved in cell wall biosynthesis